MTLLVKLGLGVLGLGTTGAAGYGVYELIRPRTISDQLKWEGKEILATDGTESAEWNQIYSNYNSGTNSDTTKKFKKLDGNEGAETSINSGDTLKDHCKKVLILELSESNKDHLDKDRSWCVKSS